MYYRDKLIRDSIFINDTIQIPYRVDVPGPKENYVTGWQNFQIYSGRILLFAVLAYGGLRLIMRKFLK